MMGQAFSRLMGMYALCNHMLLDKATAENAFRLSGLSAYQSRGKGRNKPFIGSHFSNKSKQASRSKYMPHQGAREIARRVRQEDILFADSITWGRNQVRRSRKNSIVIRTVPLSGNNQEMKGAVNYG
jgi:hypothetical protein